MSKRRINQQQAQRIQQKQSRYQTKAGSTSPEALAEGLVIKRFSRLALIETTDNRQLRCSIRPDVSSLVAGDRVVWQPEGDLHGVILSILPRQSVLNRPDYRGTLKAVAANITQVMIVIAPLPEVTWALLDSYLVMTEILGLNACIVLNKTDIPCDSIKSQLETCYRPLGYGICYVARDNPTTQAELLSLLNDQTSVFVGQSGVGKSSIISRVLPHQEEILTGAISEHSQLGKHTTSNSCLYHLAGGGHLIDSPGVREFSLADMPIRDIAQGFREFHPFIKTCQFRNCNHQNAPSCGVLKAVQEGKISQARYDNYVKLALKFMAI